MSEPLSCMPGHLDKLEDRLFLLMNIISSVLGRHFWLKHPWIAVRGPAVLQHVPTQHSTGHNLGRSVHLITATDSPGKNARAQPTCRCRQHASRA